MASALAASGVLRALPAFRIRAECEPAAVFLLVDLVEEEDCGVWQRLAASTGFEEGFVTLSELLDQSLQQRKTCPLLLMAA